MTKRAFAESFDTSSDEGHEILPKRYCRKTCEHPAGCEKQPNFNVRGATKGIFCAEHKQEGMIDVKNKTCEHPAGCEKRPTFNTRGETRGLFCADHKLLGMVNVINKTCEHPAGCEKIPTFNTRG